MGLKNPFRVVFHIIALFIIIIINLYYDLALSLLYSIYLFIYFNERLVGDYDLVRSSTKFEFKQNLNDSIIPSFSNSLLSRHISFTLLSQSLLSSSLFLISHEKIPSSSLKIDFLLISSSFLLVSSINPLISVLVPSVRIHRKVLVYIHNFYACLHLYICDAKVVCSEKASYGAFDS
ncbi:hypothetical protein BpHYR1_047979 [Brachionus plicatilis]|uniref:Uncharacterized protein n=1 Tax=Brachionus plicatilis TaxID=10195 RepID=A0A3M7R9E9_BRAPC|nr:hypothetical protein BpHYR1_047979 [Brachionus plicatilis]